MNSITTKYIQLLSPLLCLSDGILRGEIYAEIPPRAECFETDLGKSLMPIIDDMRIWVEKHRNQ